MSYIFGKTLEQVIEKGDMTKPRLASTKTAFLESTVAMNLMKRYAHADRHELAVIFNCEAILQIHLEGFAFAAFAKLLISE